MRKLLIPLLATLLLPISAEANWFDSRKNLFGKYKSKADAIMACVELLIKGGYKEYFYAIDPEDSRIGKIYENPEASTIFPSNGIFKSSSYHERYYYRFRSRCDEENETRQILGIGWKKNLNKNKIYSIEELREAWGKRHYFRY